ncbi:MAG: methylenetetrahydrofolate reductase [Desulfovibrio sp.]|nr:methylenetetrahydrofolate reductase [NAD(P)H] [Desulfovibrio sp.]
MTLAVKLASCNSPFVSLEFFPPSETEALPGFFKVVDELKVLNPLFVSVTYGAGGSRQDRTLAVTRELVQRGLTTMAHLTCVGASKKSIAAFLKDLQEAGVDNVLALRGDPPQNSQWQPNGSDFQYASDLVRFIRKTRPEMGIGVACYPTPHPQSDSFALDRRYTAEKMAAGADFAITQLFFDVREYLHLVDELRALGIAKPIIPGILTVQSFASLRRILSLSGASIPGKLYLQMEEADKKGGAEAVREAGLIFACQEVRRLLDAGAPGVHLYTLNRADICLEICRRVGLTAKNAS